MLLSAKHVSHNLPIVFIVCWLLYIKINLHPIYTLLHAFEQYMYRYNDMTKHVQI